MNIHEYQAKQLLKNFGVPVPEGYAAFSAEEAYKVAQELKQKYNIVVLKAQIHAGGRGKAGGVKVCKTAEEVRDYAQNLLGKILFTPQTGPAGKEVQRLYVEAGSNIKKEYYFSAVIDRSTSKVTFIASTEGGVEIEEIAHSNPKAIIKVAINPTEGLQGHHIRDLGFGLKLDTNQQKEFAKIVSGVYSTFMATDASQIEINPLVETAEGAFIALDAKIGFDDNALYRQKSVVELRDLTEEEPLEIEASKFGLSYVKMDGSIGCMVNGAGLAMSTMDIIKLYGKEPANFLDVGGGANKEKVTEAFKIILSDPSVKGILVNIFGGIMKCDIIAEGVIAAAKEIGITVPLVVRLEGTNVELGKKILNESGLKIVAANDLEDAAQKITSLV